MISSVCERTQGGIKAIETTYNGYRFRSRLEARWAVFFDAAGIEYEYEPEGFELDFGNNHTEYYLPDFYLPRFECYVEIKPKSIRENKDALADATAKLFCLFQQKSCACILCVGDPMDNNMALVSNEELNAGCGIGFSHCLFVDGASFGDWGYSKGGVCIIVGDKSECCIAHYDREYCELSHIHSARDLIDWRNDFKNEKLKARQARFEHGECG